jgi:hypothetical protein
MAANSTLMKFDLMEQSRSIRQDTPMHDFPVSKGDDTNCVSLFVNFFDLIPQDSGFTGA